MKKISIKIFFIFAIISLIIPMNIAKVLAADSSQDGLVVKTKTDKDSYTSGEKGTVDIAIENTNGYDMKNIDIEVSLPKGISLVQQQEIHIPALKADEIKEYKIVVEEEKQTTVLPNDTNDNDNQSNVITSNDSDKPTMTNNHEESSKVDTSDQNTIATFVVLLGVSLIIIFVIRKDKRNKKILIIALVSTMTFSAFNLGIVKAESKNDSLKNFETKQNIQFNDTVYSLSLKTTYTIENGEIVDQGEITREEWIVKLVNLFKYDATFDSYSFDDFEESKYPDQIETAIQYGLVDLKKDKNNMTLFEPNKYATREFVAYSTIKALGFYTYNTSVECNDYDLLLYPDIDKLMVHYGMFKLVNNNFRPYQYVSNNEIDIIIDKIKEFNNSLEIDSSAENEIEYKDNIKQFTLDFDVNNDKKIITSNDDQLSKIKKGDIVILNKINNIEEDMTIQVEKIENANNEYIIYYSEPSIDQVVNDIQVEGVVGNQNAVFIPEDDVTIANATATKSKSKSKLNKIPLDDTITAEFKIEGKNKTSSLSGKASLNFKEMKYKINTKKIWTIPVAVKEAQFEFLLDSEASIEIESTNSDDKTSIWEYKEDVNKKLGQVVVPTPYGVYGSIEVYLVTSISGTVKLSVQADANLSFQYKSGNLRNTGYLNTRTTDLDINAETKLGIKPTASLKLAGFDLTKTNTEAGVAAKAGISNIKADPLEYCVDANLYVYWTMEVQIGPDIINIKFKTDIFDENKSPFKRNMHFEENGYVPECTRDRNDIKGIVKNAKEPHTPIGNARVQIYNEANNIMNELYTNEAGEFTTQKLKSGEYTLIVSASEYETQRETVEVSSGKEIYIDIYLTKIGDDSGNTGDGDTNTDKFKLELGKSYRIECINDATLNTEYLTDCISEFYYSNNGMSGSVLNDEDMANTVSMRTMERGDFIDIKLIAGQSEMYAFEEDDFYKFFKVSELTHDPLKKYELSAADVISFDNQYFGNKATSITYGFCGNNLSGKRKVVDYYWNKRFGSDILTFTEDLTNNQNYWTTINECCIHEYTIDSGNATIYLWYEDAQKLVIKE